MRYLTVEPDPALAPFVSSIYWFAADLVPQRELSLPNGRMQLTVNLAEDEQRYYDGDGYRTTHRLPAATLAGPGSRPTCIDTDEQRAVIGVCFRPGGGYPFFTPPATATLDEHVPLDALWGRDGATLRERLLHCPTPEEQLRAVQSVLLARAVRTLDADPMVRYATRALDRGIRVAALADRLGVTSKRLTRRFAAQVGYRPKQYARVRRFQRVLVAACGSGMPAGGPGTDWADLAARFGYVDQSHLIHDFREFSGVTPRAYRPRSPTERNHLPLSLFSNT
ncbi:MAG: AraC family transcriptional regulator [Actinocatenispora sp.]